MIFSCFLWIRNLVSHVKGKTQIEGVPERDTERNIWTDEMAGGWRKLQ
jgi:hypothetical protein